MSLINQMLVDLERRRASSTERSQVPDHVRVLPQHSANPRTRWLIGISTAMVAAIAIGISVSDLPARLKKPPTVIAAAVPVSVSDVRSIETPLSGRPADALQPAARLTLELSATPPAPAVEGPALPQLPAASRPASEEAVRAITAIPASQVIAKAPETLSILPRQVPAEEKSPVVSSREAPSQPVLKAPAPPTTSDEGKPAAARAPAPSRVAKAVSAAPPAEIDMQVRKLSPQQQAEAEYAKATGLLHQGRSGEARDGFETALRVYPGHHSARQALAGLLIEAKRNADAERVFQEGVRLSPSQTGFAMALARLQVERGDTQGAIETLQQGLSHAAASPDYLAFLGALLQRQQRHGEAVEQFQAALRQKPQSGVWLMGMGISLQGLNRTSEAQDAFRRAQAAGTLTPELRAFVDQRLRQLQ